MMVAVFATMLLALVLSRFGPAWLAILLSDRLSGPVCGALPVRDLQPGLWLPHALAADMSAATNLAGRLPALLNDLALLAMMLVIAAILTTAMTLQYAYGELPCPLCLLQRVAMFGVCFGIIMHFRTVIPSATPA